MNVIIQNNLRYVLPFQYFFIHHNKICSKHQQGNYSMNVAMNSKLSGICVAISTFFLIYHNKICSRHQQGNYSMNVLMNTKRSGICAKLYIPSTLNIDLILWHTQLNVFAENVKSQFKSWVFPFTFQAYILPHTLNCMCVSLFKFDI